MTIQPHLIPPMVLRIEQCIRAGHTLMVGPFAACNRRKIRYCKRGETFSDPQIPDRDMQAMEAGIYMRHPGFSTGPKPTVYRWMRLCYIDELEEYLNEYLVTMEVAEFAALADKITEKLSTKEH